MPSTKLAYVDFEGQVVIINFSELISLDSGSYMSVQSSVSKDVLVLAEL